MSLFGRRTAQFVANSENLYNAFQFKPFCVCWLIGADQEATKQLHSADIRAKRQQIAPVNVEIFKL